MTKGGTGKDITQIKQEALREMVCNLSEKLYEDLQEEIDVFQLIYRDNFRHSYSDITATLIRLDNENPDALYNICQNLLGALDEFPRKDHGEAYKCLNKLYDHISLEQIRLRQVYKDSRELADESKKIMQNAETMITRASDAAEEASQIKMQVITVLGIFAAIVMAFTGGIAYSTSVLENMHKVNVYQILIAILGIGFVLINGLYVLTEFIRSVTKVGNKDRKFIRNLDIGLVLAFLVVCLAMRYDLLGQAVYFAFKIVH